MPSPRKTKSSRPFLSFLKTSPCKPTLSECQSKELPLLPPLEVGPPLPPPNGAPPTCPVSGQRSRMGFKDEADTPDYLFPPMRFGSPTVTPSPISINVRLESPLSVVTEDIGTPDNLFPPLRYGSLSDSPTQRPPLVKRPLYPPPPPPPQANDKTPDNLFPPLRFGSPSSPGGIHHAAHTRTISTANTPSRLRSATLQSPVTSTFNTPPQRLRSATVESSNTFGTPPRVIARDYASPAITRSQVQATYSTTSPKHRRRPSKLTLRTTNLSDIKPGETTPTPQNSKDSSTTPYLIPLESHSVSATTTTQRTRKARERRRSRSTGDLESLLLRQGNHRASRSESHKLAAFPVEVGGSDTEGREVYTPASVLSITSIVSDATISPDKPTGSRFDNVPLPWSTHPLSSLLPTLPVDYLSAGTEAISTRTPHILAPRTLFSLSSEEERLQLELERLKVKHTTLSQRREKLISRLGIRHHSGDITLGLQAVQEVIARVDRVARQIYICDDQVRQMEIMKRDHEIGILLWSLAREKERRKEEEDKRNLAERSVQLKMEDEKMIQVPDIQLTRATLYEAETPEDEGYEILNSPSVENEEETYAEILEKDRPLSTISIASGRFGFPIPPSRPSTNPFSPNQSTESSSDTHEHDHGHEFDDAETDYDSSFGHEPDYQAVNRIRNRNGDFLLPHQITIYPPRQGIISGQAYPCSPHTPQGSTESHSHSTRSHGHGHDRLPLPLPMMSRITPLSARRSKPDLTIPIPRRPSSRRPPPRQTSPLRLAAAKVNAKTRSLQSDGVVSSQEKFLRARESRLEDAESIMLSLATAELWTKGFQSPGIGA